MSTIKATYKRAGGGWKAALKVGGRVVWTCPHVHRNRNQSTRASGTSAKSCAECVAFAAADPDEARKSLSWAGRYDANGDYARTMAWALDLVETGALPPLAH